jgi:FkbM family methyltransferase
VTFVSYAQNFEDVVLWRALRHVPSGRYIDVGAQDPEMDSVSLAFYKAGWRGIHVDPIPTNAERLRRARPDETVIEAAVTDVAGPVPFYELGGLSSGREEIAEHHRRAGHDPRPIFVPTVRLDHLLELHDGDIHWMKIDVEGMEADVLRSWGESDKRPWIVVIESTFPTTQEPTEHLWIDLVRQRGYDEVLFDGLSRFFVHESHREISSQLNRSANVFDEFQITTGHFSAAMVRQEIEEQRKQSNERIGTLSAEILSFRERLQDAEVRLAAERERLAATEQSAAVEIAEIRGRLLGTEEERGRLERQLQEKAAAEAETAEIRGRLQGTEAELQRQREKFEQLQRTNADEIGDARSRIYTLDTQLSLERTKLGQLEARLEEASARIDEVNARWSAEREVRAAVESELLRIASLFGDDADDLADFARGDHSVALGATYAALKTRMQLAKEELDITREFAVRQFASGRKSRDREVKSLEDRLATSVERASGLERQNLEALKGAEALQSALESLQAEAAELDAALSAARSIISSVYESRRGRLARWLGLIPARRAAPMPLRIDHQHGARAACVPHLSEMETAVNGIRHTSNLLALNGPLFVDAVYRTFLKRSADRAGRDHFVARLQKGDPKENILLAVATSPEARAIGTSIEGVAELEQAQARESSWFGRWQSRRDRGLVARLNRLEYTIGEAQNSLLLRLDRIETSLEQLQANVTSTGSRNGFRATEGPIGSDRPAASIKRGISIEVADGAPELLKALGEQLNSSAEAQTFRR